MTGKILKAIGSMVAATASNDPEQYCESNHTQRVLETIASLCVDAQRQTIHGNHVAAVAAMGVATDLIAGVIDELKADTVKAEKSKAKPAHTHNLVICSCGYRGFRLSHASDGHYSFQCSACARCWYVELAEAKNGNA